MMLVDGCFERPAKRAPWAMRSHVNQVRLSTKPRRVVGTDSKARLSHIPLTRLVRRLSKATIRPAAAIPNVEAFTASPIGAGLVSKKTVSRGKIACEPKRSIRVTKLSKPTVIDLISTFASTPITAKRRCFPNDR